jgi:hypothetical protein
LQDRLLASGHDLEWADIVRDLERLTETEIEQDGKRYLLRNPAPPAAGAVFKTLGIALPPLIRTPQPRSPPPRRTQKRLRKPRRRSANALPDSSNLLM